MDRERLMQLGKRGGAVHAVGMWAMIVGACLVIAASLNGPEALSLVWPLAAPAWFIGVVLVTAALLSTILSLRDKGDLVEGRTRRGGIRREGPSTPKPDVVPPTQGKRR